MIRLVVFVLFTCIFDFVLANDTNLDSLIQRVLGIYNQKEYFEYEAHMQRFDSTRKQKFQEVNFSFKFQNPHYHINFGNQLESIVYHNKKIEINHKDSFIVVGSISDSQKTNSPKGSMDEFIAYLTSIDSKLSIEREDSSSVLVRINFLKFPNYYMSMEIEKKSGLIIQNQFYKGELAYGKTKFYFYQIDYFNYKKEENRKLDMSSVIEKMENKNLTFSTRYKNYKIKYINK